MQVAIGNGYKKLNLITLFFNIVPAGLYMGGIMLSLIF